MERVLLPAAGVLQAAIGPSKPVILYHGLGSGAEEMDTLTSLIGETGTVATSLKLFEGAIASTTPLQEQIPGVISAIRELVANNTALYADGYHMVCKSQGAAVCRMAISEMDDHRVDTFISLAGPQMGCFGVDFLRNAIDNGNMPTTGNPLVDEALRIAIGDTADALSDTAWHLAYNSPLRMTRSIFQLWRDPRHLDEYYARSPILPHHTDNATSRMRANFVRLRRAVFAVGSGPAFEGGIQPWQTGIFGAEDANGTMRTLFEQEWYAKDTLGLRALHDAGNLTLTIVPNASHTMWTSDETLIREQVLPWLSAEPDPSPDPSPVEGSSGSAESVQESR